MRVWFFVVMCFFFVFLYFVYVEIVLFVDKIGVVSEEGIYLLIWVSEFKGKFFGVIVDENDLCIKIWIGM